MDTSVILVYSYNQVKCVQYWPSEIADDKGVDYGGVTIKLQKEELRTDIVIRHLKVTKVGMILQKIYMGLIDNTILLR